MERDVANFNELDKDSVALAGGKGASLGEMSRNGLPVPPGFVVTSWAFEKFLAATDLGVEVAAVMDSVDVKNIRTVNEASQKIRDLILDAEFPPELAREVTKNFKALDTELVAVRSSATAEDSAIASWGGQLESYLNIAEDSLLAAIKKCWSSLFTPRAIVYRHDKNLSDSHVLVAVVVQKMIQSAVSGVAFTVHPVTEDKDQMVIEAGFGLGEAIVGGLITPDTYVIRKSTGDILDKNISSQEIMVVRDSDGVTTDVPVARDLKKQQKLDDESIKELANLCRKIEQHYGFPVDVEWAQDKGNLYILQSRPITTLRDNES